MILTAAQPYKHMRPSRRRQLAVFMTLLSVFALLTFAGTLWAAADPTLIPPAPVRSGQNGPDVPPWVLGLVSGGLVLVAYGLLGFAGVWFARRLALPGVFREGAGWRTWVAIPLLIGAACGVVLVLLDRLMVAPGLWPGFPHPRFPYSVLAAAAAGIGEEILMRGFVLGLWAYLLDRLLARWHARSAALWAATVIAALVFGASHLPGMMLLMGLDDLTQFPVRGLVELFLLNGILGLMAGQQYTRHGLVAAAGVHFWADIVWHVAWPLAAGAAAVAR